MSPISGPIACCTTSLVQCAGAPDCRTLRPVAVPAAGRLGPSWRPAAAARRRRQVAPSHMCVAMMFLVLVGYFSPPASRAIVAAPTALATARGSARRTVVPRFGTRHRRFSP